MLLLFGPTKIGFVLRCKHVRVELGKQFWRLAHSTGELQRQILFAITCHFYRSDEPYHFTIFALAPHKTFRIRLNEGLARRDLHRHHWFKWAPLLVQQSYEFNQPMLPRPEVIFVGFSSAGI